MPQELEQQKLYSIELDTINPDDEFYQKDLTRLGITSECVGENNRFPTLRYVGSEAAIKELLEVWFEDPGLFAHYAKPIN